MAALAAQAPNLTGLTPVYSACTGGGDTVPADGRTFVIVKNGSGGALTVTAVTPATVRGLAVSDVAVSVPAAGERWIGPFDRDAFGNAQGRCALTYSGVTSLTIAAVAL